MSVEIFPRYPQVIHNRGSVHVETDVHVDRVIHRSVWITGVGEAVEDGEWPRAR